MVTHTSEMAALKYVRRNMAKQGRMMLAISIFILLGVGILVFALLFAPREGDGLWVPVLGLGIIGLMLVGASVIIGATKLHQLQDNLGALNFEIPAELRQRLDKVSQPDSHFPYTFFEPSLQGIINGGATVGDKPNSFHQSVLVQGQGAGVT
jgi:uncharacterized membrane protein